MFASWAYKYLWISGERVMWVYHHGMLTEEPDCCPNCTECKWACSYLIVLERKRTCCRMHINEWKYAKHITIWTALVLNEIVTAQNAVREAYLIRKLIAWIRRSRQQTYFFRILGFHCNMWVAWQLIFLYVPWLFPTQCLIKSELGRQQNSSISKYILWKTKFEYASCLCLKSQGCNFKVLFLYFWHCKCMILVQGLCFHICEKEVIIHAPFPSS